MTQEKLLSLSEFALKQSQIRFEKFGKAHTLIDYVLDEIEKAKGKDEIHSAQDSPEAI